VPAIIVITDEQSADRPPHPQGAGYIVNVGGYQNGVGYGPWTTIDGWSEAILEFIRVLEGESLATEQLAEEAA
jgi:60 kDa SS-A/Ro ribonucleoprotein